jgi:uncharacterized membrane protein
MGGKRLNRTTRSARRISALTLLGVLVLLATASYGVFAAASKADFTLAASPASQTVSPGGKTSYTVSITRLGGFTGSVNLAVSGLPIGATGSFSPNPVGSAQTSSVLTVNTASSTPTGNYTLAITAASGTLKHSTAVTLVVQKGQTSDFAIAASPTTQQVLQGDQTSYAVSVSSVAGFTSSVSLSVSGLPNGVTGSFSPNPVTPTATPGTPSTLTIVAASNASTGNYTLTVTGTSGSLVHSQQVALAVLQTSSFSITGNANTASLYPGARTSVNPLITNPYSKFGLSVTSISVTLTSVSATTGCSLQDFSLRQLDATAYPITVPAGAQNLTLSSLIQQGHPSWSAQQVSKALPQLTLLDRPVNQDGCKNVSVRFGYSGSAGKG